MCISITIGHKTVSGEPIIYYNATDGVRNLYGDALLLRGGGNQWTDAEYKAYVTPYILEWFMATEVDLCDYVPPCTPNWNCEVPQNGYEFDGCGNRRLNPACNPGAIPPATSNAIIFVIVIIIAYFLMRGK